MAEGCTPVGTREYRTEARPHRRFQFLPAWPPRAARGTRRSRRMTFDPARPAADLAHPTQRAADERRQAGSDRTAHHLRESRSEEHTSELQSPDHLVCRLLLEKKKK